MVRPMRLLERTSELIQEMGWEGLGKTTIGTIFLSVVFLGIEVLDALASIPIQVFEALGGALAFANSQIIRQPINFLASALAAGADAFGQGWTGLLGPLQAPLGIGLTLFMLWEIAYYMDVVDTDVIGTTIDVIGLGSDESAAAGDKGE